MNTTELKRIADAATTYGKKSSNNKHQQFSNAKRYVALDMANNKLSPDEYGFVIMRIADKMGI